MLEIDIVIIPKGIMYIGKHANGGYFRCYMFMYMLSVFFHVHLLFEESCVFL